jgi:chromosome partitioning protein
MRRIAVVNMKGGVGKTTTAVQIAAGFVARGKRVLLVDADPQGNVGHMLGVSAPQTIRELMLGTASPGEVIMRSEARPGLGIITATPAAFSLEAQLAGTVQRETLLSRRMKDVTNFDVIVFDSSPAMNLLTYNALLCANELVLPVGMDTMALAGARQTLNGVNEIRSLWPDRGLKLVAVVPTTVNTNTHASKATLQALAADAEMGAALFGRGIRQCIDLTYAAAAHQTIWEYAPASRAAEDYNALLDHLEGKRVAESRSYGKEEGASGVQPSVH